MVGNSASVYTIIIESSQTETMRLDTDRTQISHRFAAFTTVLKNDLQLREHSLEHLSRNNKTANSKLLMMNKAGYKINIVVAFQWFSISSQKSNSSRRFHLGSAVIQPRANRRVHILLAGVVFCEVTLRNGIKCQMVQDR